MGLQTSAGHRGGHWFSRQRELGPELGVRAICPNALVVPLAWLGCEQSDRGLAVGRYAQRVT
eukprot:scaffold1270_cov56-Phaeocystis_antarctica.AAC.3